MGDAYKPSSEFLEDKRDPLVELNLKDSTELWLIHWPIDQLPDCDGQEMTVKLHCDGNLGSFESSSGKSYELISSEAPVPEPMVFLSSGSGAKIAGKISKRVSFIHYPDPSEFQERNKINLKQLSQRSSSTKLTSSTHRIATPSQSIMRSGKSPSQSGHATSLNSSRKKSSLSEVSNSSKKRKADGPSKSSDQFFEDSGRGHSTVTSSASLGLSDERKPEKRKL